MPEALDLFLQARFPSLSLDIAITTCVSYPALTPCAHTSPAFVAVSQLCSQPDAASDTTPVATDGPAAPPGIHPFLPVPTDSTQAPSASTLRTYSGTQSEGATRLVYPTVLPVPSSSPSPGIHLSPLSSISLAIKSLCTAPRRSHG